MAVGNLGATMNLLEGFVASEFNSSRNNQGLAILPNMVREIASRADLTEANLRVSAPQLFDGVNDVDVEAGAVKLIAVVVDNTEAAINAISIYATNTVVEGTTDQQLYVEVPASSLRVVLLPEPLALAALSWSSTDGGNTAQEAGTLSAANSTKVMLVYAE